MKVRSSDIACAIKSIHLRCPTDLTTGEPSSMWITWVTFDDTYASIVEYGIDDLVWNATGQTSLFIDGGPKKSRRYIHRVLLTNLDPGTTYS